jgi:hypothetical protein
MNFGAWVIGIFLLLFGSIPVSFAQYSTLRNRTLLPGNDTLQLDTLSIYPNSFQIMRNGQALPRDSFQLDYAAARIFLNTPSTDTLFISYRVLPYNFSQQYKLRDTSIIYQGIKDDREKFLIEATPLSVDDVFGGSAIQKSGSISRGVSFGNNQDLGINSTLNLELTGQIGPDLQLIASVSDDNLPIQPDGNTNKLQEFDQVYIKVFNSKLSLVAGDFWLNRPRGYFMNYKKRAQGLTIDRTWSKDSSNILKTQLSGALSKGKFARQVIQGIEGNQGPYRLIGSENEPFIIVLAGTERVYIDGRLLERGQAFDYTINYNSAEVIFTSRNQITKDSRIVIEFQYSDQNYARSLLQFSTSYATKKMDVWFNAYSEQDAKNQSLQQTLSSQQKQLLASIGDSLNKAQTNSIDSVGFIENQLLYKMVDSLGMDSVMVYSISQDSAIYRVVFTQVGQGNGDYIFSHFNALGRVYKWVAPVNGQAQGNYIPSRIIITPKQKQMLTAGIGYQLTKQLRLESEVVYSKQDVNTFSSFDSRDDHGFGNRTMLRGQIPLTRDSARWALEPVLEIEYFNASFSPIEQYRKVEFDRDWNTRGKGFKGYQLAANAGTNLIHRNYGNFHLAGHHYRIGEDYSGTRANSTGNWKQKGFEAKWEASYLGSETDRTNAFVRHRSSFSKDFKWIKIGYIDDREDNRFRPDLASKVLDPSSYSFFDYQVYLSSGDSLKNTFKVFYRERFDRKSDSTALKSTAFARTTGAEMSLSTLPNHTLNFIAGYRELKVLDTLLLNQTPENSLLGRIDYEAKLFKGGLTWNTFYEIGSGLELKREFLYIQVNDGQGIYTWIDYNNDGVKDLNEFEVSQFIDQASYIRVFTPSNQYVKTYSNEFNQSVYWRPERIWSNKKGMLGLLSRFSDQARVRISRKTNLFNGLEAYNPFYGRINDTSLISTNTNLRNTLFFNRTSSVFGGEYVYQLTSSKTLLATGFDARANAYHEFSLRWNVSKSFTVEGKAQQGSKISEVDYTSGRNYKLNYFFVQPALIFQPGTDFRISLDGRYVRKENDAFYGGEQASIIELGSTLKYNQAEKGSFQGGIKWLNIAYDGVTGSALGFEMLEALKPGVNFTWNVGYQRSLSKNLQLNIQYNGRKSEGTKTIHSGGMEVRALF